MGKQKYPTTSDGTAVDGQPNQRNHNKTGKSNQRRASRRLEAIERQVRRIQMLEEQAKTAKDQKAAQFDITDAQFTLQKIRGGVSHVELRKRFTTQ